MDEINMFNEVAGVEELLGQMVGAGSTCWTNLSHTGEFDSLTAKRIVEHGVARLDELRPAPAVTP